MMLSNVSSRSARFAAKKSFCRKLVLTRGLSEKTWPRLTSIAEIEAPAVCLALDLPAEPASFLVVVFFPVAVFGFDVGSFFFLADAFFFFLALAFLLVAAPFLGAAFFRADAFFFFLGVVLGVVAFFFGARFAAVFFLAAITTAYRAVGWPRALSR
ncbi:MAG: hypothetical protein JRE71_17700 [Deltaproteobacteria bacterium]|nr:hypothetical protein [Deltaproteobacteria bacterium]